jgi:hypothetical protein
MNTHEIDNETFLARATSLGWTVHENDGCSVELQIDHHGPGDFWVPLDSACTTTLFEQFVEYVDGYDVEEEFDCYHDAKRAGFGGVPGVEELIAELKRYRDELLSGVERIADGPCREAIDEAAELYLGAVVANELAWHGSTVELTKRLESMAKAMSERVAEADCAGGGLDYLVGIIGIADVLECDYESDTGQTKEILLCDDDAIYLRILCNDEGAFVARWALTEARDVVWEGVKAAYQPTIERLKERDRNEASRGPASQDNNAARDPKTKNRDDGLTR